MLSRNIDTAFVTCIVLGFVGTIVLSHRPTHPNATIAGIVTAGTLQNIIVATSVVLFLGGSILYTYILSHEDHSETLAPSSHDKTNH